MPGNNGFRFDGNQRIASCGPITAEKNPEYPISDSQLRTRMFSLEYAQLLTDGNDLRAEAVTRTEEALRKARAPTKNGIIAPDL